ncbi:hypothetical protein EDD22DRAFT_1051686 [Suillus occidentalis]|nr:hypothetical protein EDD22DRAFT_1051686 [Suillus occidentalis]
MSLSDVSDLTDLSSDEDDFPPSKTRTKASKKGSKEYKISGVLRAPRTTSYTAKSLYDQIIDNAIDLDPEYQRDVVWPESKQSGLIDSMLRNYYMPPVIFAVSTADDGSELRTCIDGKQRLTSIQRYMFTNERLWYRPSAANARRKLLPKQLLHQFANKQIVCVEYSDINPDQEREIFQRVQLGVALTPAERMQAIVGPWPTIIREIQSQVLGENGFQGYLDWGHARGRDFQCMASIGYLIENHPKPTVPSAPTLEKWLLRSDPVSPKLREDLLDTFRVFLILARDQKYSRSLNKPTRVSPIEFVMIGVLIYLFRDRLSLTQLSSAIEKMRKDVRDDHKDIRANSRITKHMVSFMNKRLKISELKTDGEGDKPAAGKPIKAKKRKRVAEYDDSEEEEKPRKVAASKAPPAASLMSQSKHKKASPDSRPPIEQISQAPLQAKAPLPTSAPPATYTRPSPPLAQAPPLQSNTAVLAHPARPSPTPIGTNTQVKSESHTTSLYTSPAITSSIPAADRLGPIRAAKEAIRTNTGFQVQSPVAPHTEHKDVTSVSNLGVNGSAATHDPRRAGSSSSAVAVLPQQQSPHPLYNGLGYQFQINPSEVEALLRVHGLVVPHNQQMPMNSPVTLPEQVMTAMQSGANVLSGISASTPGPSNFSQGVSVSGSGQGVQPVPAFRYLQGGPQQLYLLGPSHNGFPNGTHPAPHHSLPPRPSSTAPAPVNTGVSTAPMLPPPHSASSTGSFKDDRRHSEYERRDYSKGGGSYDKDYRRNDSRWDSSGRGSHRGRDSGWGQRGRESWRKP